jgi:hypothetical protein
MKHIRRIAQFSCLLGLLSLTTGCIVAGPREGYWDREHARYYHNHTWHECGERNDLCR